MSLSGLSSAANPIDLTLDDANSSDDEYTRSAKRPRMDPSTAIVQPSIPTYRPAFAGPSNSSAFFPDRHLLQKQPPIYRQIVLQQPPRQIIDLTGSTPSPPPPPTQSRLRSPPPETGPKVPICVGQLLVTALVLYPVPYLVQSQPDDLWAPVRLQYEQVQNHQGGSETIHIRIPPIRASNGELIDGDNFAVVEQKVVNSIGGLLGRGLIRLDAKISKVHPNAPTRPLQMLVYTPMGNIQVVGNFLQQAGLFLEDPAPPYDAPRLSNYFYFNPHNPANGLLQLHMLPAHAQWTSPAAKSVEVQRSQVDELFKSLRNGDDLQETEAAPEIATKLYPHQKKALTFLLERERERPAHGSRFSSLWQPKTDPMTNKTYWLNIVTQTEASSEPNEPKGAILADDMGLGKTIACVSLIAATLPSARAFAALPLDKVDPPPPAPSPSQFAGSVWGMPQNNLSAKAQAKAQRAQEKLEAEYARACRIKTRSRATLIICPLSTVANWEEQFRDHWKGPVYSVGGSSGCITASSSSSQTLDDTKSAQSARVRTGTPIKVYVYHGNARRPEPTFLADFDAVITTYATLASEFSKQNRSKTSTEAEDEEEETSDGIAEVDQHGIPVPKMPKPKKTSKRKLASNIVSNTAEATSALQSVMWFRIVLDEAHCIKETQTVGSRASCDLMADRRLCLTGTPVQNKLDDVYALVKFLRLTPLDEKASWTEYIGGPVKFGQELGIARLQALMKCITLRRTKETKDQAGKNILSLPPRRDELRLLKFDPQEQTIYNQFFSESKAEFNEMSSKNEVMKNYVGILQKILRLRQICDHFELVRGKGPQELPSYEDVIAEIEREGFNPARAMTIFTILREAAPIQCVECNSELCTAVEPDKEDFQAEGTPKSKKRSKNSSRAPTRASSPSVPRIILTRCQHVFCIQCYQNSVCPNWPDIPPDARTSCSACQTGLYPSDAVEIKPDLDITKKRPHRREKRPKGVSDNFQPSTKIKALLGDLIVFSRMNPSSANYDPTSVEVQMIDDKGNQLDDGAVKTVVFSQWTTMLDKIEDALESARIRYDRLDGTMKRDDRTRAIDALKHDPACEVLLVSLKAGGVGLNLTAAQRVYIMDPYWNPAVENQAVDRIHRLGQTRPVTTIKLVIENSIEARLLEVQKKKTALANMTLGNNYTKAELQARRLEELQQLFQDT